MQHRRNKPRQERMHSRRFKGPRRGREKYKGQHAVSAEPGVRRAERERKCCQRLGRLARSGDQAAIEPIRDLTDDERENHHGKELHQPHEAEVHCVAGEVVDLPSDCHALHHECCVAQGTCAPEQHERALPRQTRGRGSQRLGHGGPSSVAKAGWRAECRSSGYRGSRSSVQTAPRHPARRQARCGRDNVRSQTASSHRYA